MTDRFYPLGLPAAENVWKTSYEVQNEMRSYERSAYPPGTSIHLPGARDMFGYSTPGPLAHRLSKSSLALTEDVDLPNPREHMSIPRLPEPDDYETFQKLDVPEMMRSYQSPVASVSLSGSRCLPRTQSLPTLGPGGKRPAPKRLADPKDLTTRLEDQHFSYFVPKHKQRDGQEKLLASSGMALSKLRKEGPISFPFAGEGTGFRCNGGNADWWPRDSSFQYRPDMPTAYRTQFTKPGFYRASSPLVKPGSPFF
jgi:hypothetical protein